MARYIYPTHHRRTYISVSYLGGIILRDQWWTKPLIDNHSSALMEPVTSLTNCVLYPTSTRMGITPETLRMSTPRRNYQWAWRQSKSTQALKSCFLHWYYRTNQDSAQVSFRIRDHLINITLAGQLENDLRPHFLEATFVKFILGHLRKEHGEHLPVCWRTPEAIEDVDTAKERPGTRNPWPLVAIIVCLENAEQEPLAQQI